MTIQEFELLKLYEDRRHDSGIGKTRLAKNLCDEIINNQHAYGFKIVGLSVLIRLYCDVKSKVVAKAVNDARKSIGELNPKKESFVTLYYRAFSANEQLDDKEREPVAQLLRETIEHGVAHFAQDEALKELPPHAKTHLLQISRIAFDAARSGNIDIKDELLLINAKLDNDSAKEALELIFKNRPLNKVARNKIGCEALLFRAGMSDDSDDRIQALDILADKKYKMDEVLKIAKRIAFKKNGDEIKAVIQKINKQKRKNSLKTGTRA